MDKVVKRVAIGVAFAIAAVALFAGAAYVVGVRFVMTESLPRGWWRVDPPHDIARGSAVAACLPASIAALGRERGYLPAGSCPGGVMPIVKIAVALGGDTVEVTPAGLRVNGHAPLCGPRTSRDPSGRPMPAIALGRYVVGPDDAWVCGSDAASWDSRYYGPIPRHAIYGVAFPLLVEGRGRVEYESLLSATHRQ